MPADKTSLLESLKTLFTAAKAMPDSDASAILDVMDQWSAPGGEHAVPDESKIKTGPSQEASGAGADKMVREYSHPAPQTVAVENYSRMASMFDKMARTMKSMQDKQDALATVLLEAVKADTKPAALPTDTFIGKAESRLRLAKAALRKADMADEDEKDDKEEAVEKAERYLAAAKRLIAKAESEAEEADDEDESEKVEKAISEHRKLSKALAKAKAEMPVAKAEDEKDEKEVEKAAATVVAPAPVVAETVKSVDPNRIDILETTIKGLMETVAGKSKHSALPDFMKSAQAEDFAERVETAIDTGVLKENAEVMKAKDILSRLQAVRSGDYDASRFKDDLDASPENVRNLFKLAA